MKSLTLSSIAYARSGDKGSDANIGVIAYTEEGYRYLKEYLTAARIAAYFDGLGIKEVLRYELENLGALNFVLRGALAGGASSSLRLDSQGKTLGQLLLKMPIDEPPNLHLMTRSR